VLKRLNKGAFANMDGIMNWEPALAQPMKNLTGKEEEGSRGDHPNAE